MRVNSSTHLLINSLLCYFLQVTFILASEQPRMLEDGILLRHEHTYRVLHNGVPWRGSTKGRQVVRVGA